MLPKYQFNNKHFLVTGASSGIGQQVIWNLVETGASLTALGRNISKLNITRSTISPDVCTFRNGDLCDLDFLENITGSVQNIDGLILSAGVIDYTPAKMINNQRIRNIFNINFDANVLLIQGLLKKKKINDGASIIVIGSISSKIGVAGTALYAASKAAITSYAKVLATELSSRKIRVNVIHPGIIKTNLIHDDGRIDQGLMDNIESQYPLGFGTTVDVSNQVMYLLSDASKWVTGSEILLDGGHTIS